MTRNANALLFVMALALSACDGKSSSSLGASAASSAPPVVSPSSSSGSGSVSSTPGSYSVGGTVTGLGGSQVVLVISGGASATLTVATDGAFAFPAALEAGQSYVVAVQAQPPASGEICSVVNGSGTIGTSDVTNVAVGCSVVSGFLYGLVDNQIYIAGRPHHCDTRAQSAMADSR